VIEQAKGVLAERAAIAIDSAFALLRTYARSHNLKLADVAASVIDGTLSVSSLTVAVRTRRPENRRSQSRDRRDTSPVDTLRD